MANKLAWFICGGVVGAVAALLYAPRSGAETRAMVAEKANEVWGQTKDWGAQASENVQQIYKEATEKGQEVFAKGQAMVQNAAEKAQETAKDMAGKAKEAASNVAPKFAESNDQLRDKIEAARQRIATQVMKNAQEAEAKANDVIEASGTSKTDDASAAPTA